MISAFSLLLIFIFSFPYLIFYGLVELLTNAMLIVISDFYIIMVNLYTVRPTVVMSVEVETKAKKKIQI